jgi:hypothetical protein
MSVQREIERASQFGGQLENLVVRKGQIDVNGDNVLLIGLWALIFDYYKGILALLSNGFCGSAFALVRPVVEALVRSHVVLMGSDEDVDKIRNDEYRVNFEKIGPQIDTAFGYGTLVQNLLTKGRGALHSYTHSGLPQIARRFDGRDLTPHYSDGEIVEVIHVSTSAVWMVTNLVMKHLKFDDEVQRAEEPIYRVGRLGNRTWSVRAIAKHDSQSYRLRTSSGLPDEVVE